MKTTLAACLILFASLAHAQYVWIDAKGIKQFSDRPPPADIPQKNILKEPGKPSPYQLQDSAPVPAAEPPKAGLSLAEREADFKKRAKDQAEKDKKAGEEAQQAREQAANCAAARDSKTALESGARLATTAPNGERAYMSDAQRQQELARVQRILANCKN